jgi:hypothetical protein
VAKASDSNGFDGEGRKPGERTGLDTAFCVLLFGRNRDLITSSAIFFLRKKIAWAMFANTIVVQEESLVLYHKKLLITRVVLAVNAAS